jgi:hypothetical protein
MTDILIRGMDMPSRCDAKCPLYNTARGYYDCTITKRSYNWGLIGRPSDCPLVELPEHGDLIDRDALLAEYERDERAADDHGREFSFSFDSGGARCTEWWIVQQKLMDAHAIVPANEEESE